MSFADKLRLRAQTKREADQQAELARCQASQDRAEEERRQSVHAGFVFGTEILEKLVEPADKGEDGVNLKIGPKGNYTEGYEKGATPVLEHAELKFEFYDHVEYERDYPTDLAECQDDADRYKSVLYRYVLVWWGDRKPERLADEPHRGRYS